MMYDELVKRLREEADCPDNYAEDSCLMREAADAIEELSKQLLEMGQVGKFLLDVHKINSKMVAPESVPTDSEWWSHYKALLEVLYLPRWIPVTERLPEQRINQNTWDFEYVLCATTFGDVRPFKYGRQIGQGDAHFWNGAGYVDAYVTHWMPLPEPPKEET